MKKIFIRIIILTIYFMIPMIITQIANGETDTYNEADYIQGRRIEVRLNNITKYVSLNDYVTLVLAERMDTTAETELLKAMSIMIRTDVCRTMEDKISIDSETLGYKYKTYNELKAAWGDDYSEKYRRLRDICEETGEKIITYGGKPIDAKYTQVTFGKTLSGEEILGESYKYLKSVDCSEDTLNSEYMTVKIYQAKEFVKLLKGKYKDIGIDEKNPAKDISIISKTDDGYILKLQAGNMIMTGENFAALTGVNSCCMSVESMDGAVKIVVRGNGSGFGVSINSANIDAAGGMDYEQIIKKYYDSVEISS